MKLIKMLNDMDVLVDIGLVDPAVQAVGPDHMDIKDEKYLANAVLTFFMSLVNVEINEGRVYTEVPPWCFGALSSGDASVVRDRLGYMAKLVARLQLLQVLRSDKRRKEYEKNMTCPVHGWSMEMLVGAKEKRWSIYE